MKRNVMPWVCTLLAILVASLTPVSAQEDTIEITAGAMSPLLSQDIGMEEDLAWSVQISYLASPTFSLGVVYDEFDALDNLDRRDPDTQDEVNGDVTMSLYGVSGLWVLSGDPEFEIYATAAMGRGSLDYEDPLPGASELQPETDIDLWYEVGVGARFAFGESWNARIQLTFRRVSPSQPSQVLEQSAGALIPTFAVSRRF